MVNNVMKICKASMTRSDYQVSFKNGLNQTILKYLKDTKAELESKGYIATLEMAIEDLEDKIKYPSAFISESEQIISEDLKN